MSNNPYQPPSDPSLPPIPPPPQDWVPCPRCGARELYQPSFTWWGGAIGPRLLSHVKCMRCDAAFNAKTGASNTPAIILYQVVVLVVVGAIMLGFRLL